MAGYRDLPMGTHDAKAMSSPPVIQAFETLAAIEQELLALLREREEEHQKLLSEME